MYKSYPIKTNLFGIMGGVFLTSNPDMTGYDTKKNYVDGGGGFVYDYRNDISENSTFEIITSLMLSSCSTSKTEDGEDSKWKFLLPIEGRFYMGNEYIKFFVGAGIQYNSIWTFTNEEEASYSGYYDSWGNYYGSYSEGKPSDIKTSAHQLSGNGSVGFTAGGGRVNFLVGAKFHFPIINNAEGIEYSQNSRIDFSKDKTCVAATGGLSFVLGSKRNTVLMINYDYPLGSNGQTSVEGQDGSRNYFQQHSQSLTMSLMWKL